MRLGLRAMILLGELAEMRLFAEQELRLNYVHSSVPKWVCVIGWLALCKLPRIYSHSLSLIYHDIKAKCISLSLQNHDLSLGSRTMQYSYQSVSQSTITQNKE